MDNPFDESTKNTNSVNINPENMHTAKWIEPHENLQDMLAGYIDNELADEQIMLVEAHLIGCEACRNDLGRQQALSQRLESIPSSRISSLANQKIDKALENAALENVPSRQQPLWLSSSLSFIKRRLPNFSLTSILGECESPSR